MALGFGRMLRQKTGTGSLDSKGHIYTAIVVDAFFRQNLDDIIWFIRVADCEFAHFTS
jgi:hypothetical protein